MSSIEIIKRGITGPRVDAVVNAANESLMKGGGVCGVIFDAAGSENLERACAAIGKCKTGHAVITPGFNLRAKFIIHAVGPVWNGGDNNEAKLLYSAYKQSLIVAKKYGCHSIVFPLISSGIFGYPKDKAWRKALQACNDFIKDNPEYQIDIKFAVIDDEVYALGKSVMQNLGISSAELTMPNNTKNNKAVHGPYEKLIINKKQVDAVFFHKPEEPYGWLSNWSLSDFVVDGVEYSSVEQYIMQHKCILFGDILSAEQVMNTKNPAMQQKIAKYAKGFIETVWLGSRQMILERALNAKFSQNENLKNLLLATGEAWLVECAESDKNWACGISLYDADRFDTSKWKGTNILGFALMKVRADLQDN